MNSFKSTEPYNKDMVYATELYDYVKDPLETVNVADEKEYESIVGKLNGEMIRFLKTQENNE